MKTTPAANSRSVTISTKNASAWGLARIGVVRDATTGKQIARCSESFGKDELALRDARRLAESKGWTVVDDSEEA